jgi:predicted adenylyl cyclase CyaB
MGGLRMGKKISRELETKFNSTAAKNKAVEKLLNRLSVFELRHAGPEVNTYFDLPSGRLRKAGITIRLRQDKSGFLLTIKEGRGQKSAGSDKRFKDQKEINIQITASDDIRKIARLLGVKETSYRKLRQHWKRSVFNEVIDIDFVPELGRYFVEIEAESKADINHWRHVLGFSWKDVEPKSYIQLIREARAKRS